MFQSRKHQVPASLSDPLNLLPPIMRSHLHRLLSLGRSAFSRFASCLDESPRYNHRPRPCDLICTNSTSFALSPPLFPHIFPFVTFILNTYPLFKRKHSCELSMYSSNPRNRPGPSNMESSTTKGSTLYGNFTTGNKSAYLPIHRALETACGGKTSSNSGGYTPLSRWASEGSRGQPWNAVREVSAASGDNRRREYTSSARRTEDWDSVRATWGSERGRR